MNLINSVGSQLDCRDCRLLCVACKVVDPMLPMSVPNAPGVFVIPGSNSNAVAFDPAMASMYDWINIMQYGRRRQYIGNTGLDVEVGVWLNFNGEAELDRRQAYRRAACLLVMHAMRAALLRRTCHQ